MPMQGLDLSINKTLKSWVHKSNPLGLCSLN